MHVRATRCLACGARCSGERCASCGVDCPAEAAPRASEVRADCPRCFVALELSRFPEWDAGFVYCVGCHGCFVPPIDWAVMLDRVGGFGRVPGDELAPVPEHQGPRAGALADAVSCPVCRGAMTRVDFPKQDRLPIDVCVMHGIWFDASELASALRASDLADEHAVLGRPAPTRALAEADTTEQPDAVRMDGPRVVTSPLQRVPEARGVFSAVLKSLRELFSV